MGIMSKIIGGDQTRTAEDYVELDLDDVAADSAGASMQVHIAEVGGQADAIDIKEAVYDGDIVIADDAAADQRQHSRAYRRRTPTGRPGGRRRHRPQRRRPDDHHADRYPDQSRKLGQSF